MAAAVLFQGNQHGIDGAVPLVANVRVWAGNVAGTLAGHFGPREIKTIWGDRHELIVAGKNCREHIEAFGHFLRTALQRLEPPGPMVNGICTLDVCLDVDHVVDDVVWNHQAQRIEFGRYSPNSRFKEYALSNTPEIVAKVLGKIYIDNHGGSQLPANEGEQGCLVNGNQSRALRESITDIFGIMFKHYQNRNGSDGVDWSLGKGIYREGENIILRSMDHPTVEGTGTPQIGHANQFEQLPLEIDAGGIHLNSGIPNRAFQLTAQEMDQPSWQRPGAIWLKAISRCKSGETFASFAGLTLDACADIDERNAVNKAWKDVGIQAWNEMLPGE